MKTTNIASEKKKGIQTKSNENKMTQYKRSLPFEFESPLSPRKAFLQTSKIKDIQRQYSTSITTNTAI